jgi:hypothetical protein
LSRHIGGGIGRTIISYDDVDDYPSDGSGEVLDRFVDTVERRSEMFGFVASGHTDDEPKFGGAGPLSGY